jgi:hypothetical protein
MEFRAMGPKGFTVRGGFVLAAFFASVALLVSGCSDHGYGGTKLCGTEVPDEYDVAGCTEFAEDGGPAVAVRVVAYPVSGTAHAKLSASGGFEPAKDSFEVRTESHGLFLFADLPDGYYKLFFEDTANRETKVWKVHQYENTVLVVKGAKQTLPLLQLKTVGQLALTVEDGNNPGYRIEGVECRVDNSPYQLPQTDKIGTTFLYLPPGDKYTATCHLNPFTDAFLLPFKISSDTITSIRVMMLMGDSSFLIPKPVNVVAVEDTATGIVRVSWSKPASPELFEYAVKRNETGNSAATKFWPVGVDSVYYDAVFGGEPDSVTSKPVQYSVACIKRKGGAGGYAYGKPMTVVRGPMIDLKTLDTASSSCKAGDSIRIVGRYSNRFHNNTRVSWKLKSEPDTLRTIEVFDRSGADTLTFSCGAPGDVPLELRVTDETGLTAIGRILVQIIP